MEAAAFRRGIVNAAWGSRRRPRTRTSLRGSCVADARALRLGVSREAAGRRGRGTSGLRRAKLNGRRSGIALGTNGMRLRRVAIRSDRMAIRFDATPARARRTAIRPQPRAVRRDLGGIRARSTPTRFRQGRAPTRSARRRGFSTACEERFGSGTRARVRSWRTCTGFDASWCSIRSGILPRWGRRR